MKKIIIYALCTVCCPWITGCNNFLETKPFSSNVVDNFYQTKQDAEIALNGCYNALVYESLGRGSFNAGIQVMMDTGTDEAIFNALGADELVGFVGLGAYTARTTLFRGVWATMYAGINRCNFLLEKIEGIRVEADADIERKEEIIAEARFLRGVFYYYLAMFFGGVPYYDTSVQAADTPRESLEYIWENIFEDWEYAYEILPHRPVKQGCASKWSVAACMVRAHCYLASCKMNNVGSGIQMNAGQKELLSFDWVDAAAHYRMAYELSETIIDNSDYTLIDKYDYLFRETCREHVYNEALFSVSSSIYSAMDNSYIVLLFYQIPSGGSGDGGYGSARPIGEHYDRYAAQDIRRNHNMGGGLVADQFIDVEGTRYRETDQTTGPDQLFFNISKFRYQESETKSINNVYYGGAYPIIRYADILLLNAEARYFHLNDEAGARERLSEVRRRVSSDALGVSSGAPSLDALTRAYYNADFIAELLDERSRELCFEGHRRMDLIRFGQMPSALFRLSNGDDPTGVKSYRWNAAVPTLQINWRNNLHKIWFPIPLEDIMLNENLVQNPGYETR